MYYLCSQNKGADQLCGYHTADLRLCFHICKTGFLMKRLIFNMTREGSRTAAQTAGCVTMVIYESGYRKIPKFSDARKLCCNQPKI